MSDLFGGGDEEPSPGDLVFDFGTDGPELDGLTPQEVFVLGVEFANVWRDLQAAKAMAAGVHLHWTIHVSNVYRCKRACQHFKATPKAQPIGGDGWMCLEAQWCPG